MATSTLNVMLPEFARRLGAWIGAFTTSTNPTGTDALLISNELENAGWASDDEGEDEDGALRGVFARITSGTDDDEIRRVRRHTAFGGKLELTGQSLSSGSSITFELYRRSPTDLVDALNQGRLLAFPALYRQVHDRSLTPRAFQTRYARPTSIPAGYVREIRVEARIPARTFGENIIGSLDCDFEGDLSDWDTSNITLTAEEETNGPDNFVVFAGQQSGKAVVAASQAASMYLTDASPTARDGEEINVSIWVYSRTASRITAAISIDAGAAVEGTAHGGSGWERLEVSTVIGDPSTSIRYGLTVTSGDAFVFYADEAIAVAGQSEPPRGPSQPVGVWREEGANIVLPALGVGTEHQLHVIGQGYLSSVAAGADTMELDENERQLLYDYAAEFLFSGQIDQPSGDGQNIALKLNRHFANRTGGRGMAPMPVYRTVVE